MAPYQLIPRCTVEDGPSLAKNNMPAFWGEVWWNLLWDKTLDELIAATSARMPRSLLTERSVRRHERVVDVATGATVGYARWILPETHRDAWLEAQTPDVSDEDRRRYEDVFAKTDFSLRKGVEDAGDTDAVVHEGKARHKPKRPFVDLDYVAVHPDYQHQGIATMLVKSGIEHANKHGLDILLVAMGENARDLYLKTGFRVCEEHHQSLKPWGRDAMYDTYIMVYERPSAENEITVALKASQ